MWCDKTLSLKKYQSMSFETIAIEPYKVTNDKFLSPKEAIAALKAKIDSITPVAVILISSITEAGFIKQLTALSQCWDLPEIKRALRTAETVKDLDNTKMIIPSPTDRKVIKQLSSNNTRAIINNQTLKTAQIDVPASINGVMSELQRFAQQKDAALSNATNKITGLTSSSVDIQFFCGLPADLHKEVPNKEHIFTFILAFSDNNLQPILDLVYDRKFID